MQNYDFARTAQRPTNGPRKHYRPNPASRYSGAPSAPAPKKGINTAYLITVFTFFGFSFGIGLGLYLANTNSSVQNFTSKIFQKGGQPIRGAGVQNGPVAVTPTPPATNSAQALPNVPANAQPNIQSTPEIQSKRYYLYLGIYKPNVGYRLLQNLKKYNLTAWPRQSKEQIKLYIGFYEDLNLAKEDLGKVNKISKEYFGNARIKVYSPKGPETSS